MTRLSDCYNNIIPLDINQIDHRALMSSYILQYPLPIPTQYTDNKIVASPTHPLTYIYGIYLLYCYHYYATLYSKDEFMNL